MLGLIHLPLADRAVPRIARERGTQQRDQRSRYCCVVAAAMHDAWTRKNKERRKRPQLRPRHKVIVQG